MNESQEPRPPENNWQAPESDPLQLGEIVSRPISHGWYWIRDGFDLFKLGAATWIGMTVVYLLIVICLSTIPFLSVLSTILAPVFTAGFILAYRRAEQTGVVEFNDLFGGFRQKLQPLALLGLILFLAWVLVSVIAVALVAGLSADGSAFVNNPESDPRNVTLFLLVLCVLIIPVIMGQWFSPALVVLHDMSPWQAFTTSIRAGMKNMLPFLLYGLIGMVLAVLATIPAMLGWLVLMPILMASIYTAYQDIFSVRRMPAGIT